LADKSRRTGDTADKSRRTGDTADKSRRTGDTADKSRRTGDTADKSRRTGDTADKHRDAVARISQKFRVLGQQPNLFGLPNKLIEKFSMESSMRASYFPPSALAFNRTQTFAITESL
jgi:hypothetical protein